MSLSDNVAQHISKVENLAKQIREAGETISDTAIMTKILSTLPLKFRNVRQAWLSLDEAKQTIPNLTSRLLDEEANLVSYEEAEIALAAVPLNPRKSNLKFGVTGTRSREPIHCYNCGKRGHISRNCRLPPKKKKEHNDSKSIPHTDRGAGERSYESAFNVVDTDHFSFAEDSWIMDSGALAHVTYRRDYFTIFEENFTSTVFLGNNQSLSVKGKGTV